MDIPIHFWMGKICHFGRKYEFEMGRSEAVFGCA